MKMKKRIKKLEARQAFYENKLAKEAAFKRPGSTKK
jgi:uncharacterized coiled-coil protein SlyX